MTTAKYLTHVDRAQRRAKMIALDKRGASISAIAIYFSITPGYVEKILNKDRGFHKISPLNRRTIWVIARLLQGWTIDEVIHRYGTDKAETEKIAKLISLDGMKVGDEVSGKGRPVG